MLVCWPWWAWSATDTLYISLRKADSLLVERNLYLLAVRHEIDIAEARTIQSKLFNNPTFSSEWNLYNPGGSKWLDVGSQGQKIFHLEQALRIGGQRRRTIELANLYRDQATLAYFQTSRDLKYELHKSFFRHYYLARAVANIQSQLNLLKELIGFYEVQYRNGNVSLQELTRLKAVAFEISNKVNQANAEIARIQEDLKILLAEDALVFPSPEPEELLTRTVELSLSELQELGLQARLELTATQREAERSELELSLARREAIPDLSLGVLYDQAGSYVNDYSAITAGFQIPLFHRNQGLIQERKIQIQQSKIRVQAVKQQVLYEIEAAFRIYQSLLAQAGQMGPDFDQELDQLSEGLVDNYIKGNLSLVEFVDLFGSYNSTLIEYNQFKADLNDAYEELNYAVGETIYP